MPPDTPAGPAPPGSRAPVDGAAPTAGLLPDPAEGLAGEELLQALWADQRRRWPRGEGVPAQTYLERYPALAADPERAAALIFNEFVLCEANGAKPAFDDYLGAYPAYAPQLQDLWDADHLVQPPAAPTGDRLGDYALLGEVGRGGQAVVYKARNIRLDRLVALKMIAARVFTEPSELERFRREAQVLARFPHPNIVPIYDIGDHQGQPFLALEFLSGGSLAQQLGGVAQPPRQAAELLLRLARAMQALHQQGIVHRDLKPGNILFTDDGVPKISDFGLAKNLGDAQDLSRTGAVLGTVNYMAPEQARGKSREVGPPADVYALGAMLYEMLTGRPPITAESPTETMLLLIHLEPVPPSRLRPKVPRDLETICLKCLQKEPRRRYANAGELADDLQRFLDDRPIQARPVSRAERLRRWCRRQPATAALVATALALVGLALGGGLWLERQQATRRAEAAQREERARQAVDAALAEVAQLRRQGRWPEAGAVLAQAESRVDDAGALRPPLEQARADLKLAAALEDIRLKRAILVDGRFDLAGAAGEYADVFARAGLVGGPEELASRLRASAIREQLVAALDDWAWVTPDAGERARLLRLARRVDPDPLWRDRFRDPAVWQDRPALERLAAQAPVAELSPQLLTALGQLLTQAGADAAPLLREAQWRRPDDFWLNFELGNVLMRRDEAVGYYQAALVLRPHSGAVYTNLGHALFFQGRREEGLRACRRAIELEPRYASAHYNLGQVLRLQGHIEEALAAYRRAIELDPRHAPAHTSIGVVLSNQGRLEEAIATYRRVMDFDPRYFGAPYNLGLAWRRQGRMQEALTAFRRTIELNPRYAMAHRYLGELLLQQGRFAEALAATQRCLELLPDRDPAHAAVAEQLGTCQRLLALDAKLPAILRGTEHPADADEQRDLARLCQDYQRAYATATRLYAAAFADQPSLAADRRTQDRYHAARAAALAGTGQGTDAAQLDEPERSRLRGQALAWLRAERDTWARQLAARTAQGRLAAGEQLRHWRRDTALAGVRDPESLRRLPEPERRQWQELWTDVAALPAQDPLGSGRAYAARQEWVRAAACYAEALHLGPIDDSHFWFEYAALKLLTGDRAGYRKACYHMVQRCGQTRPWRTYLVARACTLAEGDPSQVTRAGQLAEGELTKQAGASWSLTERGALAYRAGRSTEAALRFRQSLEVDGRPSRAVLNWLWLALAEQRLGKKEAARRWLEAASRWLDQPSAGMPARAEKPPDLHLHNWLEAHVLRREAAELLRSQSLE